MTVELAMGFFFKETEVGYPSASQTDFDSVRLLAESDLVPDDVTVVVFTPAGTELIERTVEGLPNVLVHMYNRTAPTSRRVVLGRTGAELRELIRTGGRNIARLAGDDPGIGSSSPTRCST